MNKKLIIGILALLLIGLLVSGAIRYRTLYVKKICFPNDVCIKPTIQDGRYQKGWIQITNYRGDQLRNVKLYMTYATNAYELAPNGKFLPGYYPDTDKWISYNKAQDQIEYVVDEGAKHKFVGCVEMKECKEQTPKKNI